MRKRNVERVTISCCFDNKTLTYNMIKGITRTNEIWRCFRSGM